ncbi:MAG: glycosyltransferase, partial [Candidatus Sericytochromatia bacterium]|nr:glycosyltransferase [Candidatus Sericytochromatia bacterium]
QELGYYYGVSDIFIHAAKNEPWGVSVQEALSCNCTVITSNKVGSSKDLIVEGKNGFTYTFGEARELAQAVENSFLLTHQKKTLVNIKILHDWSYEKMGTEINSLGNLNLNSALKFI